MAKGHHPWDLKSKPNVITNANIPKTADVGTDRVLRLNYEAQNDHHPD
jgi:hypothetical protein